MAENETLDIYNSPRWRRLLRNLRAGKSAAELGPGMERSLRSALRRVKQILERRGLTLAELFRAARQGASAVSPYLRKCSECRDFVQMLVTVSGLGGQSREVIVQRWVEGISEKVFDQLKLHFASEVPSQIFPDITTVTNLIREVESQVEPEVQRIITKLSSNPGWRPTAKRGFASAPGQQILSMSLLPIEQKNGGRP